MLMFILDTNSFIFTIESGRRLFARRSSDAAVRCASAPNVDGAGLWCGEFVEFLAQLGEGIRFRGLLRGLGLLPALYQRTPVNFVQSWLKREHRLVRITK